MQQQATHPCPECAGYERAHDAKLEYYMGLVDQQSRLFRQGQAPAARELDGPIQAAKAAHDSAAKQYLQHTRD